MEASDIRVLSHISRSLWSNPEQARKMANVAVTAASLLELNSQKTLDRTAEALIERNKISGSAATLTGLNRPFFRLTSVERFTLVALYIGQWSYRRVADRLNIPEAEVSKLAWRARLELAFVPNGKRKAPSIVLPTGSPIRGPLCPEYSVSDPWTNRFLDRELGPQETAFIKSHLLKCKTCQVALTRARDLFYHVRGLIPDFEDTEEEQREISFLKNSLTHTQRQIEPWRNTFLGSLKIFLKKWDVRLALGLIAVLALISISS